MKYYFLGIKGAGLSALATFFYDLGDTVFGYDDAVDYRFTEDELIKRNIPIYSNGDLTLEKDMLVITSAALEGEHGEILRCKKAGLEVIGYYEMLGRLSLEFSTIAVSGTHGKTTTTSLLTHVLNNTSGHETNYIIGDGSGYSKRGLKNLVIEACEFKRHFLKYMPSISVITNIELEHVECYKDINEIIEAFQEFCQNTKDIVVACGDEENVKKLNLDGKGILYGLNENNDVIAKNIILNENGSSFDCTFNNNFIGHFNLPLYGKHMIQNALAVITICHLKKIDSSILENLIKTFKGAKRRFKETIIDDIIIIDDYAHHPTEVKVTLESARQKYPDKEIVAVMKPNTYTRMKSLYLEFVDALKVADKAYVTDIYCDREQQDQYPDVTSNLILDLLSKGEHISEEEISKLLRHKNAVVVFMSCKDVSHLIRSYKKVLGADE